MIYQGSQEVGKRGKPRKIRESNLRSGKTRRIWQNEGILSVQGIFPLSLFLLPFCLYICQVIPSMHQKLLGKIRNKVGSFEKYTLDNLEKSGKFSKTSPENLHYSVEWMNQKCSRIIHCHAFHVWEDRVQIT